MNTLTTVRQLIDQLRNEARSIDLLNRVSQVTSDSLSTILVHSHLIDQQSTFLSAFNPNDLQVTANKNVQATGLFAKCMLPWLPRPPKPYKQCINSFTKEEMFLTKITS